MAKNTATTSIIRAAIYCRVSTEDQADRGTIQAQVHALRQTVPLWGMEIVGEYLDDGYSGTLPLEKRPEGLRLMDDAKAGKIDVVAFLKTDRLARSLRHLLDIVDYFDEAGVQLRCVSEPFDTSSPVGRMIVQMMGSFAEMERSTILARTTMGRERIARDGRWTGGPVPYGYFVNNDGFLIVADTPRDGYEFSESEIVGRIFNWVADGQETARGVSQRLNAEGIPCWQKTQRKGAPEPVYRASPSGLWWPVHIAKMLRSPVYRGEHIFNNTVSRVVPALVDTATWGRANQRLTANKRLPNRKDKFQYLLRGLVKCVSCESFYAGHQAPSTRKGKPVTILYYRCGSQMGDRRVMGQHRCEAKMLSVQWIEDLVWNDIKKFVMDPGEVLEKLQAQMDMKLEATPSNEERRQELERILESKKTENDRLLDAYRRGSIDLDQFAEQIDRSKEETQLLNNELMDLIAKEAETGQAVGELATTDTLLRDLRDAIESDLDFDTRRTVVEALVAGITVETEGAGRYKTAAVTVNYRFSEPSHVVDSSGS